MQQSRDVPQWFRVVSQAGCALSLVAASVSGYRVYGEADLLVAVLRGAQVWMGTTLIWVLAVYSVGSVLAMRERDAHLKAMRANATAAEGHE